MASEIQVLEVGKRYWTIDNNKIVLCLILKDEGNDLYTIRWTDGSTKTVGKHILFHSRQSAKVYWASIVDAVLEQTQCKIQRMEEELEELQGMIDVEYELLAEIEEGRHSLNV